MTARPSRASARKVTPRRKPSAARPSKQPASRTAWLVVDRHGYPDSMYGPAVNGGPAKSARRFARSMNEAAKRSGDTRYAPWRAVKAHYPWPPVSRAKRGEK